MSIFEALMMIDPQAAIVPSNKDPAKAIGLSLLLRTAQDYKTMMDISLVHWGKPSDRRGRLALSFYISSAILTPDLALLKSSCHFKDAIKKARLTLSHHNLEQTESQVLAFFSGKSPQHTWRKDLAARFQQYMDIYLLDDGGVANLFGENEQVPRKIPFYLKAITIRSTNHTATVIAIYVGKLHHSFLSTLITKAPFEEIELVPMQLRRKDKDAFDQCVQLHNFLCQDSGAIKLRNTSVDFRDSIKTVLRNDAHIKAHIINIAEAASTTQEGTLYIQCMIQHKDEVVQRVEAYIDKYTTDNPGDDRPDILTRKAKASDTSASETQTVNTWTTRFQTYLADKRAAQSDSKPPSKSNIPGAISYSDMAAGFRLDSLHQSHSQTQSAISSPTNSRLTAPSLREQQLEDRIQSLESHILQQQTPASPTASVASTIASTRSIKKTEFEVIMAQQMQMITALVESNKAANDRMEQQMGLISNLQQTVADLTIRVNDRESDASTITSYEQRKRRIPHPTSKSSMRRIHPSDAGTVHKVNVPPDPGETNPYENSATTYKEADTLMEQDDNKADSPQRNHPHPQEDEMSQSTEQSAETISSPHANPNRVVDPNKANGTMDVNGSIDDDDLLAMMASDATAMHNPTPQDISLDGPLGTSASQC